MSQEFTVCTIFENFKNIDLNSNQNRKFKWEEMGFNFDLKAGF